MSKIRVAVLATALATSTLAAASGSPAAFAARESKTYAARDNAVTAGQIRAVDRYWTPDRMRMAGALVPEITPIPPDDHTPYDPVIPPADQLDPGAVWTHGGAVTKTVGRLFFTFDDGYDGSCTATSVTSTNHSTIITAAHCFRGTGDPSDPTTWNHNEYFVPGYRNGTKPYGGFTLRTLFTSSRWDTGTSSEDVAVAGFDGASAVVNRGNDGRTLQDTVGAERVAFRPPATGEFIHTFGYPNVQSGTPWLGARVVHCAGPVHPGALAPKLYGLRCDMAHGASGGPHLANFDPSTGHGTVVGVTTTTSDLAAGNADDGQYVYATRLGADARSLYQQASTTF